MQQKNTRRGFTLIELLVVVLIIGILAAVAVPQYKKAVTKSRLATIKPIMAAIKTAEEVYYMQNGDYTTDLSELDISSSCSVVPNPELETDNSILSCNSTFLIDVIGAPETGSSVNRATAWYCPGYTSDITACSTTNLSFYYKVWLNHSDKPNKQECGGKTNLGKEFCTSLCGSNTCQLN